MHFVFALDLLYSLCVKLHDLHAKSAGWPTYGAFRTEAGLQEPNEQVPFFVNLFRDVSRPKKVRVAWPANSGAKSAKGSKNRLIR